MVDLKETTMVNGIAILMMWFLLFCRRKNRESIHTEDKIYDGMVLVSLLGALIEIVSFFVDGRDIYLGRQINYMSNSLCFLGTVSVGMLWCLYVDLRINRSYKKTRKSMRLLMIPWLIEIAAIAYNLLGTGLMFTISQDNVYQRGAGVIIGYVTLIFYFVYSIHLVVYPKSQRIDLNFFPVYYFIVPCLMGIIVQLLFYGVSASWVSVAIALIFVQMQTYAENIYTDELSGLFNRRYLKGILTRKTAAPGTPMYGIMMDINSFKNINDSFGHSAGDQAIIKMGEILCRSIPDDAIAIRYAGDEFIVLLPGAYGADLHRTMDEIHSNLSEFNKSGAEPFDLSLSMGYAALASGEDAGTFLRHMDESMYEEKRRYHETHS